MTLNCRERIFTSGIIQWKIKNNRCENLLTNNGLVFSCMCCKLVTIESEH